MYQIGCMHMPPISFVALGKEQRKYEMSACRLVPNCRLFFVKSIIGRFYAKLNSSQIDELGNRCLKS